MSKLTEFEGFIGKEIISEELGHEQWLFEYKNNWGASVIKLDNRPGYEIAVMVVRDEGMLMEMTYNSPFTNGVIPNLTEEGVIEYLGKIKNLAKRDMEDE